MKLGIIGLPGSGKSTVFKALTGGIESAGRQGHSEPGVGVVKIKDERLDYLTNYHKPKKVTPAQVEYLDIAGLGEGKPGQSIGNERGPVRPWTRWSTVSDSSIHIFRGRLKRPRIFFRSGRDDTVGSVNGEKRLKEFAKDARAGEKSSHTSLNCSRSSSTTGRRESPFHAARR